MQKTTLLLRSLADGNLHSLQTAKQQKAHLQSSAKNLRSQQTTTSILRTPDTRLRSATRSAKATSLTQALSTGTERKTEKKNSSARQQDSATRRIFLPVLIRTQK